MSNLLNIKDQNGNWIPISVITNGIQSITQNQDYTLTITLNDGTTYTTTSIKGEDGQDYILTENDKQEIAQDVAEMVDIPVDDVQINGESVVTDGVAEIPYGTNNVYGIVKGAESKGINIVNGILEIRQATSSHIKNGALGYCPIAPQHQHESVFYGLAKSAGDTTQSASDNAVGTYTDEAKASIQSMLGVPSEDEVVTDVQINGTSIVQDRVANVPIAVNATNGFGVVRGSDTGGVILDNGALKIRPATDTQMKNGSGTRAINAEVQHKSVFYGLAKAAGSDEKDSTLPVGQYTDSAQTAIKQMLGVKDDYDSLVVEVTGTDPVITGKASYRYNCGELYTLSITPPESGTMDIIFTSGATPTILTLPNTVKMPTWWAGIDTNTTYEMCITDGVYCGVMSWAT